MAKSIDTLRMQNPRALPGFKTHPDLNVCPITNKKSRKKDQRRMRSDVPAIIAGRTTAGCRNVSVPLLALTAVGMEVEDEDDGDTTASVVTVSFW